MVPLRWWAGMVLIIWSCNHYMHSLAMDQLALNMFDDGRDEALFFIPVGSGELFYRHLATNNETDQLVVGSVSCIEVTLNGGYDNQDLERVVIDKDTAAVTTTITGHVYRYKLNGFPSASNYSTLLSSLTYVSNLNSQALNDSQRNITITAYDNNNSSTSAVALLTLIPANLEAPVFSQSTRIQVQIRENATTGDLVTSINAYDPEGNQVTFGFSESSPSFSISASGEVRVLDSATLDYENATTRVFNLCIIARDNDPVYPRSSKATLIIHLINVNDNLPVFSQPNYIFSVLEEVAGAVVGTVQATDADGEDISSLYFAFQLAPTALTFNLNPVTGEISVRLALDYEDRTNYTFEVTVTDGLFTNSAQVMVNVIDIAENRPVIFPTEKVVIVDLDSMDNGISLNEGTGAPLVVSDEDSTTLVSGYASITVLRSGILETFPNQYGACECTNSACLDVFTLCGTSFSLQQDLLSGVTPASSSGPTLVPGLNYVVYSFNGRNDLSNNWLEIPSATKTLFLQTTDDFTVSVWIRVASGSSSAYILTFELGTNRYFSLYESSSSTLTFYYFRDNIPGITNDDDDDGRDTQVALTFFYDPALFPNGLRDNGWHFLAFTIDFPIAVINVDGYEHRPLRGNYRNQFQSRVDLAQLTDGTYYNMPAPILTKTQAQIDGISGKIGGTARGNRFSLDGEIRQFTLTNTFDTRTVICVASCNNRIDFEPNPNISSTITTQYNPVTKTLFFSGAGGPNHYTTLLQSLIYYSNSFLLPEESGEIRVISISISDEVDFGNIAQISVVGRSNQHNPVLDVNGDSVEGVDFEVDFHEDFTQKISVVSSQAFISDADISSSFAFITVTINNPQLSINYEFLSLVSNPPTVLAVTGINTYSINFTAVDLHSMTANIFISALLSVRYNNLAVEPVGVDRSIHFMVSDGFRIGLATTTVRMHTNNDPPSLRLNGYSANSYTIAHYTESSTPIRLAPNLTLSDPDSPNIVEGHAWIERVFDAGNESIAFDFSLLPLGVSCIPSSCNETNIRIISAGTQHQYQALLQTLRYVNLKDIPNLRDRVVNISISDGSSSSNPISHILINFLSVNPRIVLELDAPDQNFTTSFMMDQSESIECHNLVRVVDSSVQTLESIIVSIRDNLPEGVTERDEITLTMPTALEEISVEINRNLKKIILSRVASTDVYIDAIQRIRYFNPENDPYPINRFLDFLVIPGGGAPNDQAHCNITIINNNANLPSCNPSQVQYTVMENLLLNTVIAQIMVPNHEGSNSAYSVISSDNAPFRVTPSGEIISLVRLDREIEDKYHLQLDSCDSATSTMCCGFNVSIVVMDVNDNSPTFEFPFYQLLVDENWAGDLANFTIQDDDIGTNAEVASFEIDDESYSPRAACMGHFSVQRMADIYILSTRNLDFEQTDVCNFSLVVTDAGVPSLTGSTDIEVMIQNLDDNPPVFSSNSYIFSVTVEEDNNIPVVIGRVSAIDVDSPSITFSLIGTSAFEIDPTHGYVSIFSAELDIANHYQFTVVAQDPANHTANATVIVNVLAGNKYPPVLDLNATAFGSDNAEMPIIFREEGDGVVIVTNPLIRDPDEIELKITRIYVEVANSGSLENEVLSVAGGSLMSSNYSMLSSTPGMLILEPARPSDIPAVYSLLQNIQYQNTEGEISACRDELHPCKFGPSSRTVLFSVFDGIFFSNHSEAYVTFQDVNDRPFVDLDDTAPGIGFQTEFRWRTGPVSIANIDNFSLSDEDDENLESLTCVVTNPFNGLTESMFINDTDLLNTFNLSTSDLTQSLQITGISNVSNYKVALSLVRYTAFTDSPIIVSPRQITVSVSDGELASDPAVVTILIQTEGEGPSGTLSDQTTGLMLTTQAQDLPTNALVIIVLAIIVLVTVIVIIGLIGTVVMVYKRKSIPRQPVHTIRDQATMHANPSYAAAADHIYERISLHDIPTEPTQANTDTAVTTAERIMDSNSFYVNADLDEGTGGTYVSVMDSTGDSYVTIIEAEASR